MGAKNDVNDNYGAMKRRKKNETRQIRLQELQLWEQTIKSFIKKTIASLQSPSPISRIRASHAIILERTFSLTRSSCRACGPPVDQLRSAKNKLRDLVVADSPLQQDAQYSRWLQLRALSIYTPTHTSHHCSRTVRCWRNYAHHMAQTTSSDLLHSIRNWMFQ